MVTSGTGSEVREPQPRPAPVRATPTLLGVARATVVAVLRHPEAALVVAMVVVLLGDLVGWW